MIDLRPFAAEDLSTVGPWFDNADTLRWLGGRDWPAQSLRLAGDGRLLFLALRGTAPVGLLDVETYEERRASFAIAVAPAERRAGMGTAVLAAAIAHQHFASVVEWFAGIEHGNDASRRLVERLGFRRVTDEDADGFTYYARGESPSPWYLPD